MQGRHHFLKSKFFLSNTQQKHDTSQNPQTHPSRRFSWLHSIPNHFSYRPWSWGQPFTAYFKNVRTKNNYEFCFFSGGSIWKAERGHPGSIRSLTDASPSLWLDNESYIENEACGKAPQWNTEEVLFSVGLSPRDRCLGAGAGAGAGPPPHTQCWE